MSVSSSNLSVMVIIPNRNKLALCSSGCALNGREYLSLLVLEVFTRKLKFINNQLLLVLWVTGLFQILKEKYIDQVTRIIAKNLNHAVQTKLSCS